MTYVYTSDLPVWYNFAIWSCLYSFLWVSAVCQLTAPHNMVKSFGQIILRTDNVRGEHQEMIWLTVPCTACCWLPCRVYRQDALCLIKVLNQWCCCREWAWQRLNQGLLRNSCQEDLGHTQRAGDHGICILLLFCSGRNSGRFVCLHSYIGLSCICLCTYCNPATVMWYAMYKHLETQSGMHR